MAELRIESVLLGNFWTCLLFAFRRPIYGGFAYLVGPRLVLSVNVHLPRNVSRNHQGALRNGKMADSRLESGILGIPGLVLFPSRRSPIYGGFAYLIPLPRVWR